MAYAIIETGGKQIRVEPGRFYDVDRLAVEADGSLTIDRVLFVENDGEFSVGQPTVEGAAIEAKVLKHLRGRKVLVYKMKPKKKTRKKRGHRQELTRILVNSITLNGQSIGAAAASAPTAETAETETADA
ncbi:50S ribosomal protein L21 [Microcoleus sp. FACHB-1515]|uniref:50S ribosomal protein L21 n=1 Tax=Cyanophyceae TaxID=3028117 RepID=UPI0016884944|nr:50S ribosomal protein L21 [Microcoleus sp. FACHB-1515]MBD2091312.1 50S ribosomal protein L21 [Microcoleus sp. FACHB-1515]